MNASMKRRTFNNLPFFLLGLGLASCDFRDRSNSQITTQEIEFDAFNYLTSSPSQIQLNWMGHWLGEDRRENLVREVAQEYSFLHQDVNLNLKFWQELGLSHAPGAAKEIATKIRSGTLDWDIIWLNSDIYQMISSELSNPDWGAKYLVDFEQVNGFVATQKPFIVNDSSYRNQSGGMLTGPYIEGAYYALFYNQVVAQRLEIEIKDQGMTFDDLIGYVEAVDRYNRKNNSPIAAFYESKDWTTMEFMFQNLVKSEINDFTVAKSETSSDQKNKAVLKTFKALESLGKLKPLIPSHTENIWTDTRHLILDDRVLFYVNGTWMYSHWQGIDPSKMLKIIPVELPVFQSTNYYLGNYLTTWGVMKHSPNRDRAIELLMSWCTPKVAEKWVRYTRNPTGLRGNFAVAEEGTDVFEKFQSNITAKYGSQVNYNKNTGYLFGKNNHNLSPHLEEKIRTLMAGKVTASDAYRQIMNQLS